MFDLESAMTVWKEKFGNATRAIDEQGLTIMKTSYGDKLSKFGWVIRRIEPNSIEETDDINNLKIIHVITNDSLLENK